MIGVAGGRSWIARTLVLWAVKEKVPVEIVDKTDLGSRDLSHLDCLYLILGRAKPTDDEMQVEIDQAMRLILGSAGGIRLPKRIVYLSSQVVTRAKAAVEGLLSRHQGLDGCRMEICRPAAIFGTQQDGSSPMLVPSLARDEDLELLTPDKLTNFVACNDLCRWLLNFADPAWWNSNGTGEPHSIFDVPGTFTMTPHQMRELVRTLHCYWDARMADEAWWYQDLCE